MKYVILILIFLNLHSYSQKTLDLNYFTWFGKEKHFEFFIGDKFSYRLKGELFRHTHRITNMQDTILVFDNEEVITTNEIKSVRIPGFNFSRILIEAGILFTGLDMINNTINSTTPIIRERALVVSGCLIGAGLVVSCIQDKHIRIRKNSTFRIMDIRVNDLNVQK